MLQNNSQFCKSLIDQNKLFKGTPGVGKSQMSQILAERTGFTWLDVSKLAVENNCLESYDPEYKCPVLNEDQVNFFFCLILKLIDFYKIC